MNQRFLSVLIFAFVVALGASMVLYRLTKKNGGALVPTSKIVVATRDLDRGLQLQEVDLRLTDWPGSPPAGAANNLQDLIGRGVVSEIYKNEPVLDSRLASKGGGVGLAPMIPPGMRAFPVRVNEVVGVAGFVTPGSRVDVLISGNAPNPEARALGSQTRTLLQNIEVLSAGKNLQKDTDGKPVSVQVVTLLVSPPQAEMLTLAAANATIQLVLRNPLDLQIAETQGAALAYLFGQPRAPVAQAPGGGAKPRPASRPAPPAAPVVATSAPKPYVMEMIHGSKRNKAEFQETEEVRQ
jgi:pilus assembly protein CpaB